MPKLIQLQKVRGKSRLRHIEHQGIVLDLSQALVGGVAQVAVIGPSAKLDLGDQGRLYEDQVLALEGNGRPAGFQGVECLPEIGGIPRIEARSHPTDINPVVSLAAGNKKAPDAAAGRG